MSTTNPARRVLAVLAGLTVAITGVVALSAAATSADAATAADTAGTARAASRTTVTLKVPHCEGCKIAPAQGIWDRNAHQGIRTWDGPNLTVHDGVATFRTATRHLHGMSLTMSAPWERRLGYVTNVVMRYGGYQPGDRVTVADARHLDRASACWAGTDAHSVTLTVVARKKRVEGVMGRTAGTIAFVRETQEWMRPMREVRHGVLGSQDLNICGRRR